MITKVTYSYNIPRLLSVQIQYIFYKYMVLHFACHIQGLKDWEAQF